jgi:hypothetical protein
MTLPSDPLPQTLDELLALAWKTDDSVDADLRMALYLKALALAPDVSWLHYNIGLIHKYRGEWALSLEHNRRASDLAPDDEASHWNMGIAATARRDWPAAREAWRRSGLTIEVGEGPIESDLGITPVRLNPDGAAEVVWGRRLDPVRVRIENIPYADSGFRFGDVVLHDGAPVGERESNGRKYSVFNVLELYEASAQSTWEVEVCARDERDLAALTDALEAARVEHENWTANVRALCKQCSEGTPHEHHDEERKTVWPDRHLFGVSAASPEVARQVFETWSRLGGKLLQRLRGGPDYARLLRFECVLAGPQVH